MEHLEQRQPFSRGSNCWLSARVAAVVHHAGQGQLEMVSVQGCLPFSLPLLLVSQAGREELRS